MAVIPISPTTRVFVLTGAGISAESGISTFRDANGLWENHRIEDVASPDGFAKHPELVWRFYAARRAQAATATPNAAHLALAELEAMLGDNFFLCTQNVDGLHEAAGSSRLVHMHGELAKTRCSNRACASSPFVDARTEFAELPRCSGCGSLQRPHIVWFGEVPFELAAIQKKVSTCDVFVTIGSSGAVYPAAGFVSEVKRRKAAGVKVRSIYVGLERPENAHEFDDVLSGKAGDIVPTLFSRTRPSTLPGL